MRLNESVTYNMDKNSSFVSEKLNAFDHENKMMSRELDRYQAMYRNISMSLLEDTDKKSNKNIQISSFDNKRTSLNFIFSGPISPSGQTPCLSRNKKFGEAIRRRKRGNMSINSLDD
jgi:hypothetical protein